MKIAVGSDHGGLAVKQMVVKELQRRGMDVEDYGCFSGDSVDYPDYAHMVARRVATGTAARGVLVCTTGIGMSIVANKYPGIRAALCLDVDMATRSRSHNDSNILVLAGALTPVDRLVPMLKAWLETPSPVEERHVRRVRKMQGACDAAAETCAVGMVDPELFTLMEHEVQRQQETLNFIASENHASAAVRQAQGSVLTNKYAEGYPGKRWYNGCRWVDAVEQLTIDRACRLFGAEHANVQPHCGSSANMAVYFSMLSPGDTILAMNLSHGGHLTHGSDVNFSGRLFHVVHYGVSPETERIDYDALARQARECRPRLIVAGASAYPRILDFERFSAIAKDVGARLLVDMAHIAGLVAAGVHPSPVPHADYVTSTTHKTLRGPRSGMILCRSAYAADIDKQVFPGLQGGPLMHTIASKAVCFHEALQPAFADYGRQVVANAAAMAETFQSAGLKLVSGGTDNHLMLINLDPFGVTGKDAAAALDAAGIVVNKNTIPFDKRSPFVTSGIRIGTPAITTRGMKEAQARTVAQWIADLVRNPTDTGRIKATQAQVMKLASAFPAP